MLKWAVVGSKFQTYIILQNLFQHGFIPQRIYSACIQPKDESNQLQTWAHQHAIPCTLTDNLMSYSDYFANLDLLLVCRYHLLPRTIFAAPKWGSVNVHSSLLPQYRGVHPVSWALINGETQTGVTLHVIDEGIDTGGILYQAPTSIDPHENIWCLTERLNQLSAQLCLQLLQYVTLHHSLPNVRPQTGEGCYAPRRQRIDGLINWRQPCQQIYNLVRALQPPYPAAYFVNNLQQEIDITHCHIINNHSSNIQCGMVVEKSAQRQYLVQCHDGLLQINITHDLEVGTVLP
ncbi:MAG: hypothetical protein Tsb005_16880 [Gammaproteobacteria bacterium]